MFGEVQFSRPFGSTLECITKLLSQQNGERYIPKMVRLGVDASVHPMIKGVTLDSLVSDASSKDDSFIKREEQEFEGFRTSKPPNHS